MALSDQQALFVREYLVDFNATGAALRAGYSPKTAYSQGSRLLLKNVEVASALSKEVGKRTARLAITSDRVLQEVARLALFDIRKLFDVSGHLIPITQLDDDTAAALSSLEVTEDYALAAENGDPALVKSLLKKLKTWDKTRALDMLMKHLGMMPREGAQVAVQVNVLTDPRVAEILAVVTSTLAAFPEARAAVSVALRSHAEQRAITG